MKKKNIPTTITAINDKAIGYEIYLSSDGADWGIVQAKGDFNWTSDADVSSMNNNNKASSECNGADAVVDVEDHHSDDDVTIMDSCLVVVVVIFILLLFFILLQWHVYM